ncbi:hypothetical protein JMUB7465_25700 [Staphylococcus aureus]|nr:hypothetical protein [Staphylococcus aureus]MBU7932213.1 hypothetical protein [Staphylococcus aureus]MBU7940495.1 hypothetical protein [Staphylococcus aureus]MBU7961123.1 hypothetical protein [Staphylococcus aureus]MBU7963875.1 hypothetical protein [Staphylococcus aureus]
MSNTDKYLRDIARELKCIRKELQKRNEMIGDNNQKLEESLGKLFTELTGSNMEIKLQ